MNEYTNTFDKVFLNIDFRYRLEGDLFGKEWDEVRKMQIEFLLKRPLIFKVLTEKIIGPDRLDGSQLREWGEVEKESRKSNRVGMTEELADMVILLLTFDTLDQNLSLPSQKEVVRRVWEGTVDDYCRRIGMVRGSLIDRVKAKIMTNCLRNPEEAFTLVADEEMQTSVDRYLHNWNELKSKRNEAPPNILKFILNKKDWWKSWLYVDSGGWLREKQSNSVVQY